ncbi:MAG: hypothetical protein AB8B80_00675 [Marinicellaceae bacterium]
MRFLLLILFITLFNSSSFAALSINKITQSGDFSDLNFNPLTQNKPAILEGKIVYFNKHRQLTVSSGTLDSTSVIQLDNQPLNAWYGASGSQIITEKNHILFINRDDLTLWKTDGINSSQLSDLRVTYFTKDKGNVAHAKTLEGNALVTTDGESVNSYPMGEQLSFAFGLPVCEMDKDNLIVPVSDNSSSEINLYRYDNGKVIPAAPEIDNENSYFGLPDFKLMFDQACYYQYETDGKSYILRMGIDGSVTTISGLDDELSWVNIFELGGKLYLNSDFPYDDPNISDDIYSGDIYHLPLNSLQPEKVINISNFGLSIIDMSVSENYFYVQFAYVGCVGCPIPSPTPPPFFQVYNENFNLIRTVEGLNSFEIFNAIDKDLMLIDTDVQKIVAYNQGVDEFEINMPFSNIDFVVGGEQASYAIGTDRISQTPAIYKISQSVIVSNQLSGLWTSKGLESQGLSIHTGIRSDGSEYMFVSLYIYKDGNPFWVAGSQEINLGDQTIEIELFEFKGSSFLTNDASQNNERLAFGTLKIIPDTCDSIQVEIDILNVERVDLAMQRIQDISHVNSCSD